MNYDQIGSSYSHTRSADPRIVAQLIALLNLPKASKLVDIGAGTGNYSQKLAEAGYDVTAVEPSQVMRAQAKQHGSLTWLEGSAEALPCEDGRFDGAVMTLCLHHLEDWQKGIQEALRVSQQGPVVIFAFDIEHKADFWLFDYFPTLALIDQQLPPSIATLANHIVLSGYQLTVTGFPLPKDLDDHFLAAGWARPEIYLDQKFRDGISSFAKISNSERDQGVMSLQLDLQSGQWLEKYGEILNDKSYDKGYVFIRIEK